MQQLQVTKLGLSEINEVHVHLSATQMSCLHQLVLLITGIGNAACIYMHADNDCIITCCVVTNYAKVYHPVQINCMNLATWFLLVHY